MAPTPINLISPMSPAECVERLKPFVDSPLVLFGSRPLIGEVSEQKLQLRKRISYRNSFQSRLVAELSVEDHQTRLCCSFQTQPFGLLVGIIGIAVLFVVATTFGTVLISGAVTGAMLKSANPLLLAIPFLVLVLLVVGGAGVAALGKRLARGEEDYILDTLSKALEATRV
jgi:hypothetical protein